MHPFEILSKEATEKDEILGLILLGSRGKGFKNEHSDYDAVLVVKDDAPDSFTTEYKTKFKKDIDLSVCSLSEFEKYAAWESPEAWDRYDYSHVKIAVDKTGGTLEKIVKEKGEIPEEKRSTCIAWWIDGYVNGVFRSVKCIRNGNQFGAQLEASNSMFDLLTLVFGMEGRHRPFLGYVEKELEKYPLKNLPWSSKEFVHKVQTVLQTADLQTQQELLRGIEKVARAAGHGSVFDAWEGKDVWTMEFKKE